MYRTELYPSNSVPRWCAGSTTRYAARNQVQVLDGRKNGPYWFAPLVADGEAGFGAP